MTHSYIHHAGTESWHELAEGFSEYLELESRLGTPNRQAIIERAAKALAQPAELIIDLGSGTGADSVALAHHFSRAQVHSLDISEELLDLAHSAAANAGLTSQITQHKVDLNGDWPTQIAHNADLVWASLALHHLRDPAAALRQALQVLKPGGLLVMTELIGEPTIVSAGSNSGGSGLQDQITLPAHHAQNVEQWKDLLQQEGFIEIAHHEHQFVAQSSSSDGVRYIENQLRTTREHLERTHREADLASIDAALIAVQAESPDLTFSAPRGVFIAIRPRNELPEPSHKPYANMRHADVAVLGGGAAGLAAAVVLARSRRSVVLVDAAEPRNALAYGAYNLLGQEGSPPLELLARGRAEAESYGVQVIEGSATAVSGEVDDFTIDVDNGGQRVSARRIILATGLVDDLPNIPGVRECWGRTVLHCPFCHGWEVRDQRIAILARNEVALHQVLLFRQLSNRVTVFLHEAPDPNEDEWNQLKALGVRVVHHRVERLLIDGDEVRGVEVAGGRVFAADAVIVAPKFNARTELYEMLEGIAEPTPYGVQIPADQKGMTTVPGVWAVGNASEPMAMVSAAAASGVMAGAAIHGELAMAELNKAVHMSTKPALTIDANSG